MKIKKKQKGNILQIIKNVAITKKKIKELFHKINLKKNEKKNTTSF